MSDEDFIDFAHLETCFIAKWLERELTHSSLRTIYHCITALNATSTIRSAPEMPIENTMRERTNATPKRSIAQWVEHKTGAVPSISRPSATRRAKESNMNILGHQSPVMFSG